MKNIILLVTLFLMTHLAYGQGDAPALIQGQNQTGKTVGATIQVPNNLSTKISGSTTLLEVGNNNILVNPSFEHSTFSTGWTESGTGTDSSEPTVVVQGKKAFKVVTSAQTINLSQSSTLYAAQFADGVQGLLMVWVKTNNTGEINVCSINAGTVSTTNCVAVNNNNKWGLYKVPFILGATSNGISIVGASGTGTTYIDNTFVGAVDLKQDVDQSKIAGESYFAGTASCTWSRTNTAQGAFTSTAACPGPTVVYGDMGTWATTDSDLPIQTITNLPAGTYVATFMGTSYQTTGGLGVFSINDGTTTCSATPGSSDTVSSGTFIAKCVFKYTSSGTRTFQLYGGTTANTVNITADALNRNLKFSLEYFGSDQVYSASNSNTEWTQWTPTITGFGTPSAISMWWRRTNSNMEIYGQFTSGVATAVTASITLPGAYAIGGTISNNQAVGSYFRATTSTSSHGGTIIGITGGTVLNFSDPGVFGAATVVSTTAALGNVIETTGNRLSIRASFPISGWDNSNLIVGSFAEVITTPGITQPVIMSSAIAANGAVSNEKGDLVSGNCTNAAPSVCTFTNTFSSTPNCSVTVTNQGASACFCGLSADPTTTTASITCLTGAGAGCTSTMTKMLLCHGEK